MSRRLALVAFLVGCGVFGPLAGGTGLVGPQSPLGIVHLEFAWRWSHAAELLGLWERADLPPALERVRLAILWDFGFLVAYAGALFFALRLAAAPRPGLARLAWAAPLAAAFDAVENLAMLRGLDTAANGPFRIAALFAGLKFALTTTVGVALVAALVLRVRDRRRIA